MWWVDHTKDGGTDCNFYNHTMGRDGMWLLLGVVWIAHAFAHADVLGDCCVVFCSCAHGTSSVTIANQVAACMALLCFYMHEMRCPDLTLYLYQPDLVSLSKVLLHQ
jgi:hypothetical protein